MQRTVDSMKKVELLAPAGDLEKLKFAIIYGADAVYLGGEEFGLRAQAGNFSLEEMREGLDFVHSRGKKAYLTVNVIPHNDDIEKLPQYLDEISELGFDAIILSDPGVFSIVREILPDMDIHISTQANNTNWRSAAFWHRQGAKRIILARELSLDEIREIRSKVPEDLELEAFIHGSMCISYSGRCLLSSYMAGRDSNRGLCAHPCRWKYYLVEEKRPGQYMPVLENERGTFIFNSRDLCTIEFIPQLVESGLTSFKIEGRIKSSYYVATVVKAYRQVIDAYYSDPEGYAFDSYWLEELKKVSHREYTTGFYFGEAEEKGQIYETSSYIREYDFIGVVKNYDRNTGVAEIEQRNRFEVGDEIEVLRPKGKHFTQIVTWMEDDAGNGITEAPHPQMTVRIPVQEEVAEFDILRRKKKG